MHETKHLDQLETEMEPQRTPSILGHAHRFLSSESTATCLFFCGGGDSRVWRTADTFSRVVTLVTVAVTEQVNSDCWGVLTADES